MNPIKIFSDNKLTITAGILLGAVTFVVHGWNRISNNVVSLPTEGEKSIAFLVFIATILITFTVPFILYLFTKRNSGNSLWPIFEITLITIGVLLGVAFISIADLIPGPYQDVIGVFLAYVLVVIAYLSTFKKAIVSLGSRSWGKLAANGGVMLLAATAIFVVGWMMVYFE